MAPLPAASGRTITIDSATAGHTNNFVIPIKLTDLSETTTQAVQASTDKILYSDGTTVPAGVKYSVFQYQITEAKAGETHEDLAYNSAVIAGATSAEFINVYDNYAKNPAEILIRKEVKDAAGNDHEWAANDSYEFEIEALNGAPITKVFTTDHDQLRDAEEQTTVIIKKGDTASWVTTNAAGEVVTGDPIAHAAAVSVPIKMSDLDNVNGDPVETVFEYRVTEKEGSLHGITYTTSPITVVITATPQADGSLELSYEYKDINGNAQTFDGNGLVVTNHYGVTEFSVAKEWNDGKSEDENADRPEIKLHLVQKVDGVEEVLTTLPSDASGNKAVILAADGTNLVYANGMVTVKATQLPVKFQNLPNTTSNGKAITYSVTEDSPEGYKQTDMLTSSEAEGVVITITNTILSTINVEKIWHDGNDAAGRPDVIVTALIQGSSKFPTKFATAQADEWKVSYDKLPIYDENGEVIFSNKRW